MRTVYCYSCQQPVDYWDVYAEYTTGCLCSSCILKMNVSVRHAESRAVVRSEMITNEYVMRELAPTLNATLEGQLSSREGGQAML